MKKDVDKVRSMFNISVLLLLSIFLGNLNLKAQTATEKFTSEVKFKKAGSQPLEGRFLECRRVVVGPWVHQPKEYEGYNGFVGWPGLTRLKSGRLLLTFSSGYWHASPPLTEEILKDEKCRKKFEPWYKLGMPFINAPRGGRTHIMHSDDNGKTWSEPELLVDTELDDRHPTIIELDDGTWFCTFFTFKLPHITKAKYILSYDEGKTWSEPKNFPGGAGGYANGPAIQLTDGAVLVAANSHSFGDPARSDIVVLRSEDRCKTFEVASVLKKEYDQFEPTMAQLPNGQVVMLTRTRGDIYWSNDGGKTWITSETGTGVKMFEPHLIVLPNGILADFHGGYDMTKDRLTLGGLSVILSSDNGHTWHGPESVAEEDVPNGGNGKGNMGYRVDPSVYGSNSNPILLPDGTVYTVYLRTGGHYSYDARTQALWSIRVQINDSADGIRLLPSPGGADFRGGKLFEK